MGRKRLNTGQVSVPGSGDTIHDGGNKLHDNFDELYRAFGDQRLERVFKGANQEEWITPHGAGYFQHYPLSRYASAVASGSMHDIDSSISAGHFPVILPAIGLTNTGAKRGERVIIQDSANSWGSVEVRVSSSAGQSITGSNDEGKYILNENSTVATFTVIDDTPGSERWGVKINNLAGNEGAEVETSRGIPFGTTARVDLHYQSNYNSIKVLVYAESKNIDTTLIDKRTCYEMHVMNTPDSVFSATYSVLNTNENDVIAIATPVSYRDSNGRFKIALDFTTNEPITHAVTVTVKSVGSLKQKL